MGRVTNYRLKINALLADFETQSGGLSEHGNQLKVIANLKMVLRLLDALKASGSDEGPGFCNKLAETTGYSRNRVSDMLSGKSLLNQRFVKSVSTSFGVSEEYILNGVGPIPPVVADPIDGSIPIKEAVRIMSEMTVPERYRAVAMLIEMAQKH